MEIRLTADGTDLECDFGRFGDNTQSRPGKPIEPLILVDWDYPLELLRDGPKEGPHGGLHSITQEQGTFFIHTVIDGRKWTWQLYPAYFWDDPIFIGRWPD